MEDSHNNSPKHDSSSIDVINGVNFTPREIDVLACIIGGRSAKKIAASLSLSPRTVENYTRNIMLKIECNSRENILDFLEKSDKISLLRKHYSTLFPQASPSEEESFASPPPDSTHKHQIPSFRKKKAGQYFLLGVIFLCVVLSGSWLFFKQQDNNTAPDLNKTENSIRSDLIIPVRDVLLERPQLIAQLDEKFKGKNGIQTIALIGPGGAGKTTLARQYAHLQKNDVVWEINAET